MANHVKSKYILFIEALNYPEYAWGMWIGLQAFINGHKLNTLLTITAHKEPIKLDNVLTKEAIYTKYTVLIDIYPDDEHYRKYLQTVKQWTL